MAKHLEVMVNKEGLAAAPVTPQMFGNAGKEHMKKYGEICSFIYLVLVHVPDNFNLIIYLVWD